MMDEKKTPNPEEQPDDKSTPEEKSGADEAEHVPENARDRFRRLASSEEEAQADAGKLDPDAFELPNRWQTEDFANDEEEPTPPEKTLSGDEGFTPIDDTSAMAADIEISPVPVKPVPQEEEKAPNQMPWLESASDFESPPDDPDWMDATAAQVGPSQMVSETQPSVPSPMEDEEDDDSNPTISQTAYDKRKEEGGIVPPPPLGETPISSSSLRVDSTGMPLPPGRPTELDMDATQVSDSAFSSSRPQQSAAPSTTSQQSAASRPSGSQRSRPQRSSGPQRQTGPHYAGRVPASKKNGKPKKRRWRPLGCIVRSILLFMVLGVLGVAGVATWGVMKYRAMVRELPGVEALREQASQFETTRILDSNGGVLYEILDPTAGRRTYVELEDISPYMLAAIISTEDEDFYTHPGINILAIARAFYQNYTQGEIVSGASTITQQLARALVLGPDEAYEQSYDRKLREALIAIEITNSYSRDDILELYLNEVYFGNLAYGIEAASQTYFTTTSDRLTLAQASFLAGLPQAPSVYDVYTNPEAVFLRQQDVLRLMFESSEEQGCIYISTSTERVCIELAPAAAAAYELHSYDFPETDIDIKYPHWVNYVRMLLEEKYDPQTIYRSGFTVETTLDPTLQNLAQTAVYKHISGLTDRNVQSGALVAINPQTGEILAMVGSADYYNEAASGQINMAISPRQPGSSIKPITYMAAFEKGWTPATIIWDVESEFPPSGDPNDERDAYIPINYDGRYHGPVTLRTAIGNSYNIPAVKALEYIGIYNDGGMLEMAQRLGINTLTEDYYGLSLTLGGGEVTLLQLTGAYAIFANGGVRIPPVAITRIIDHEGNVVFEYEPPQGEQVISPQHAFLISDILSDNDARSPSFSPNNVLNTAFPAAAKTGTTNDFRDNWTMGYTPEIAVGVWVGNPDFTEMINSTGTTGAAPIWAEFLALAVEEYSGGRHLPFERPDGIVELEVCAYSGTLPSQWCEKTTREIFDKNTLPPPAEEDLWQMILIDTWTGLRASPECAEFTDDKFALNVSDPWGREWLMDTSVGKAWLKSIGFDKKVFFSPERECTASDDRPKLEILGVAQDEVYKKDSLRVSIVADGHNLDEVILKGAQGKSPEEREFDTLVTLNHTVPDPEEIIKLKLNYDMNGWIHLWLIMTNEDGGYAERRVTFKLNIPEPTEAPTATPEPDTPTPTVTNTPEATATDLPTETPTLVPPSNTPIPPTETPVPPTDTPAPTNTPAPTTNATETVSAGLTGTAAAPSPIP